MNRLGEEISMIFSIPSRAGEKKIMRKEQSPKIARRVPGTGIKKKKKKNWQACWPLFLTRRKERKEIKNPTINNTTQY
jgi:hypothetical protein